MWQKNRLSALLHICTRVYRERSLDRLLALITEEAARIMEAERATVFLLDLETEEFTSFVAIGVDQSEAIRFSANSGLAGHAARTGELINVRDVYADKRFNPQIDRRTGFRTHNLLAIPLRGAEQQVTGVFQVLNKKEGHFNSEDEELLVALAGQAQVAIDNAMLYQELDAARKRLEGENLNLKQALGKHSALERIIGLSSSMRSIKEMVQKIANTPTSVLISGESGTGKSMLARTVHYLSARADGPFISLNCAALPEGLLESELFGIEQRVATGVDQRIGKIEAAHGGTLFLDEIGDMSLMTQSKILDVLQERTLTRIGGHKVVPVDIRVIAATNKDLRQEIAANRFREDLYYRLNVVGLHMPPLRQRIEDLPLLIKSLLELAIARIGKRVAGFDKEALDCLRRHHWGGNIRELENEIERAVSLADAGQLIGVDGLSDGVRRGARRKTGESGNLRQEVAHLEIELIIEALAQSAGVKKVAAATLGLSREGLRKKMKRYKLL